jgi:hypothetical protein
VDAQFLKGVWRVNSNDIRGVNTLLNSVSVFK